MNAIYKQKDNSTQDALFDLNTVGAVLGHRSAASTKRYSHLATDNLKAAIGRIGRKAA